MLSFVKLTKPHSELNHLLEILHLNNELSINRDESKIFLNKGCKLRGEPSSIIGIPIGHLPIKYLGLFES